MIVYKIVSDALWRAAEAGGEFEGASVDASSGFIHLSTAAQVPETAAKHFKGQRDLLLVAVDAELLGDALKWEISRGGQLFPHLYGVLPLAAVRRVSPIAVGESGVHSFAGLLS